MLCRHIAWKGGGVGGFFTGNFINLLGFLRETSKSALTLEKFLATQQ